MGRGRGWGMFVGEYVGVWEYVYRVTGYSKCTGGVRWPISYYRSVCPA